MNMFSKPRLSLWHLSRDGCQFIHWLNRCSLVSSPTSSSRFSLRGGTQRRWGSWDAAFLWVPNREERAENCQTPVQLVYKLAQCCFSSLCPSLLIQSPYILVGWFLSFLKSILPYLGHDNWVFHCFTFFWYISRLLEKSWYNLSRGHKDLHEKVYHIAPLFV